jgi:hypothetical protein
MSKTSPSTTTMSRDDRNKDVAADVRFVSIECLRTSYAPLRSAATRQSPELNAELPLRVAACENGTFEVLDGFKRLVRWRERSYNQVPVVVEAPALASEHKRMLLVANAPSRTTTALDEARVVCSLIKDDGLTPTRVARLLGHKPSWVTYRIAIGTKLSPTAEERVALGEIGPTLAYALTQIGNDDQYAILESIDKHSLNARESLLLVRHWRVADPTDRQRLLRSPLEQLRDEESGTLSPKVTRLEAELHRIRHALADLGAFQIPS